VDGIDGGEDVDSGYEGWGMGLWRTMTMVVGTPKGKGTGMLVEDDVGHKSWMEGRGRGWAALTGIEGYTDKGRLVAGRSSQRGR
jgi:hypothetical protein